MHVGIATPLGWQGIMKSVQTLTTLLTGMGHRVVLHDLADSPPGPFDLLVLYERLQPHWLGKGRRTVLIPNQEQFSTHLIPYLTGIDLVLAKSRHAEQVFSSLGAPTRYVGFCSPDHHDPGVRKDYSRWAHLAGSSIFKGTAQVIRTWTANPDLPPLTVFSYRRDGLSRLPDLPHLKFVRDRLSEPELARVYNEYGVHLCPSTAEGWNYTMTEAMSARALVVTTDAPPMNEHVTPERGVLCRPATCRPLNCGVLAFVAPEELARVARSVWAMPEAEKQEKGERARRYVQSLRPAFEGLFCQLIEELIQKGPGAFRSSDAQRGRPALFIRLTTSQAGMTFESW